jgi:hypothetical protein
MKKFMILALALAATFMFVVPAMAVDVEFSGNYRVRGFWTDNMALDETGGSDAAFDHRFHIEPVFKIHDNLKLTTRIRGQEDAIWGDGSPNPNKYNDTSDHGIIFKRVYADINLDAISLRIGRMASGACGITYSDSEGQSDRIKLIMNDIDPFYLDFTYTKATEDDYLNDTSDQDADKYHFHGFYTSETMRAGMLFGFINSKTQSITGGAAGYDKQFWHINPYAEGNMGPLSYLFEAEWKTGDYQDYSRISGSDRDYDAWRWLVSAAFNTGPASVGAGWAHSDGQDYDASGDHDYTDADGGGMDWQPFLILTHYQANANLGGIGNLNPRNSSYLSEFGFDIYYLEGSFTPMEKLTLSAILGWAYADEDTPQAGGGDKYDDEIGWEFDVGAKYQVMDNLSYDVKLGYFSPGDLWEDIDSEKDDETWSIMHSLVVTF